LSALRTEGSQVIREVALHHADDCSRFLQLRGLCFEEVGGFRPMAG
jgi:hypothetical protein